MCVILICVCINTMYKHCNAIIRQWPADTARAADIDGPRLTVPIPMTWPPAGLTQPQCPPAVPHYLRPMQLPACRSSYCNAAMPWLWLLRGYLANVWVTMRNVYYSTSIIILLNTNDIITIFYSSNIYNDIL